MICISKSYQKFLKTFPLWYYLKLIPLD